MNKLTKHFAAQLASGKQYASITAARKEASALLERPVKAGSPQAKLVDEAVEQGVVIAAHSIASQVGSPVEIFDLLVDLYNRQPTLGVRTSTSMRQQAYSTPAPLAWLCRVMGGISEHDFVYDSAAGNGMLLMGDKLSGIANELNPERSAFLSQMGFVATTSDATTHTLPAPVDKVIINPPFGKVKNGRKNVTFSVQGVDTQEIDHAITVQALSQMKDSGKAVIIIGSKGFEKQEPKEDIKRAKAYLRQKKFYDFLWNSYNVVDHFTVSGNLYVRQGAKFPVDVIVIDGKGASSRPKPYNFKAGGLPSVFTSWENIKNAILVPNANGSSRRDSATGNDNNVGSLSTTTSVKADGHGEHPSGSGPDAGTRVGELRENPNQRPEREECGVSGSVAGKTRRTSGNVSNAGTGRETQPGDPAATLDNRLSGNDYQVAYQAGSQAKPIGSLVPRAQSCAAARAIDRIASVYGDIDEFVASELGYTGDISRYFSAEQVDAIAMMIASHKEGKAFILGDQTGVGKGRCAAAMMIYAKRQNLVPVFLTQDPTLFGDMVRDLTDIGHNEPPFEPLATNALAKSSQKSTVVTLPDGRELKQTAATAQKRLREAVRSFIKSGKLSAKVGRKMVEFDAVFTTYSQMQPVKKEKAERQNLLQELAPHAFFILDESHNAGGSVQQSSRKDDKEESLTRASIVRELLNSAAGISFLSATFAKRPEVMDLYAATGMSDSVEDTDKLPASIAAGGVPLQQVLSEMLVDGGVMIRRERSFDGVEFAPKVVDVGLDKADKVAEIFRAINAFDQVKEAAVKEMESDIVSGGGKIGSDNSTGDKGITSTVFSSILWNIVDQMLLSLKADAAADEAVESWRNGEVPVLVVDNTIESGLNHYLEANPANFGDEINFTFRNLVQRYLERSREIIVKHDVEDPKSWERIRLSDEELGTLGVALYADAEKLIKEFGVDIPASPIDAMRCRMESAGMSVAEITGRSKMVHYGETMTLAARPASEGGNEGKARTVAAINDGSLDAVIINRSGATGLSMHSYKKFKNQRRRHMIVAQSAKNIDEFMQVLGRVHRTGQVVAPKYTLLLSNAPAETRPASVLVKKLASLNANVTASASNNMSFEAPDVLNPVGDQIIGDYMVENEDINKALGGPVEVNKNGEAKVTETTAKKVSGRMALMPVEVQQAFWDSVIASFNEEIEELNRINKNPLVAQVVDLAAETLESTEIFEGDNSSESPFRQPAYLHKVRARRQGDCMTPDEINAALKEFYGEELTWRVSSQWCEGQRQKLREEFEKEFERRSPRYTTDDGIANLKHSLLRTHEIIRERIGKFYPGKVVRVSENGTDGDIIGVVIGLKCKRKPTSASSWVAEIALASPERTLKVPLSRLGVENERQGAINVVSSGYSVTNYPSLDDFNEPVVTHEERYIATGNILAAFAMLSDQNGQITFYTDKDGNTSRGVILPRKFNVKMWDANRPVVFKSADDVLRFVNAGGLAHSPDFAIQLSLNDEGLLQLRSPRSRQRSGSYTTSKEIMDAGRSEFVSCGAIMRMETSHVMETIKAVMDVGPLQAAGTQRGLARDLTERKSC